MPNGPIEVRVVNSKTPTERIVVVAAVVIALCALGVSLWQGWQTRAHNRLSVLPNLEIYAHFDLPAPRENIGLYLVNTGVGPAKITRLDVYFDDKLVQNDNDYVNIIKQIKLDKQEKFRITPSSIGKNTILASEKSILVFGILRNDITKLEKGGSYKIKLANHFRDELKKRFRIEWEYCSIYKECWPESWP